VASIARDDPSIGGGHVCWGSYDGFNFAGWRSRCVPGMHCDHNAVPSQTDGQTDRQTDTDIVALARDVYITSRAKKANRWYRARGDMIELFKMSKGIYDPTCIPLLDFRILWIRKTHCCNAIILCNIKYLTSVSHLGWHSRAMRLGGLGLIRTSP